MVKDNFGVEITEGCEVFYVNSKWKGHQVMARGSVHHVTGSRVYLEDDPDVPLRSSKKQWVVATKVAVING